MRSYAVLSALLVDLVCVLVFVVVGKSDHGTGTAVGAVLTTAWPFLAGALLGWASSRAWRSPAALWPTGVSVWAITVVGGMVARRIVGEGTPLSFVIVTSLFLAATMLGWRAIALVVAKRRQTAS
ncbi:DUF3054 domain-containing protein [Nocardiopsis lambiniae]|uniref:DUF3054 domain-containing protein n=1 Tax=Nocardiopsis lambiniae TaxID=3075539 RepID=A0ABU2M921_9ACTN|nr:DUF3054 domain-containing protein [Nocardiopsis sp. DSM 44743]MDT0329161.1 DUF3054 domain-containing protein [Nocardiopsis sp. DSM 44743]